VQRRARHKQIAEKKDALGQRREGLHGAVMKARAELAALQSQAGVAEEAELARVLGDCERAWDLVQRLDEEKKQLAAAGDRLSREALSAECGAVDRDALGGEIDAVIAEIDRLVSDDKARAIDLRAAEEELGKIGGGAAATEAAEDRLEALAAMQEEAERYVRLRAASLLLDRAIERFRKRRESPLLRRAGELFALVTAGRFAGLEVDRDDDDNPMLLCRRATGATVPIEGLSDGTADQLWLALRAAAVEMYLAGKPAVPFVADDLFINYDDGRAAAGFRLLAELSRRTQVLFFTHHEHLVEIARRELGPDGFGLVRL
jgi:uncharacterized protein YhaN